MTVLVGVGRMASWREIFRQCYKTGISPRLGRKGRRLRQRHAGSYSPVPALVEQLESRTLLTFTFHGGALITNVQVQDVFLGSDWNTQSALQALAGRLDSFTSTAVSGMQIDGLTLAGYNVYRGGSSASAVDNVALDKSYPASGFGNGLFNFIFDSQGNIIGVQFNLGSNPQFTGGIADDPTMAGFPNSIQGELQKMINSGQLIAPGINTLYNVFIE